VPAGGEHGAALLHRDDPVGALERLAEGSATGVGAMIQSTKDGAFWRKQVELSLSVRNTYERWWEQNLKAYAPINRDPEQYGSEINTNRTFTLTERKKADLFYQRPDVTLQPTPLMEGPVMGPDGQALTFPPAPGQQSQAVTQQYCLSAHEEIVNEKLGEDGIDATEMMDAVLFDIICTQGVGFTKMGYEAVFTEVEQPDPAWQPDPMLPLEMQKPAMVTVPVPIHEQCFWHHFSGKQAIIPHNFRSTEWDRAPFLGMQFELPLTEGNRQQYQLPPDFTGKKAKDAEKQHYDHGTAQEQAEDTFTGVEIFYRSALFRDDVRHPEHLTQLVLVDGIDEPVIERDCPYQTLDEKGALTPDSLIGFPIHPFSVRKMTDSAYVPSDGTMIRPLESELNVFRHQMVQFRDASTLKFVSNADILPAEALAKIVRAPIGGIIPVPSEAFVGEGAIKELPHGSMPRESFTSNDYIDNDMERTTAVGASQSGVQSTSSQTATAEQLQNANANARMDKERGIILKRYCKGVTKFATLIQRYLPVEQAAAIVGGQRAQMWDVWRKTAAMPLAFTAMPDSALRVDQAVDRKQAQELYSFLANDPFIAKGRAKLLEKLLRKYHIDPTGIVAPPDPPKPQPPKLALSFKGEDLVGPQAPIVLEILQQQGIKITPEAVMLSQQLLLNAQQEAAAAAAEQEGQDGDTQHGGKLAPQESLSKHAADQTGAMQGIGGMAMPMGAGGMA
jgi:hypothetical protein